MLVCLVSTPQNRIALSTAAPTTPTTSHGVSLDPPGAFAASRACINEASASSRQQREPQSADPARCVVVPLVSAGSGGRCATVPAPHA
jgi:hypothetical protein